LWKSGASASDFFYEEPNLMRALLLISFVGICITFASAQKILVAPYLQPGNASSLSNEQKVLIWQTDSVPGKFVVTYQLKDNPKIQEAKISKVNLTFRGKSSVLYRATLRSLVFDTLYTYRVSNDGAALATATFATRSKKPHTNFVVLGDFGGGTTQQAAIAYQISKKKPQFVLTTGDNVYQDGLASEYQKNLFPYYMSSETDMAKGALIMNAVPVYMVLGNHDVRSDNLDQHPDGLAYFYYSDNPMNAPLTSRTLTPNGNSAAVSVFKKNTRPRFPRTSNFSFDYGNVHITCLDANDYVNPLDPALVEWMRQDIGKSKATWKMVAFHQPGFNSSQAHYDFQYMRLLSPLFESLKVDLVLAGHVHNYQRSVPLKFAPRMNEAGDQYIISPEGRVDGAFTLDSEFDGVKDTTPNGIIYIVTGAGGGGLYDMKLSQKPETWTHTPPENWVPFTKQLISHVHSFTLIETNGEKLTLQQIDLFGNVLDKIDVSK